MIHLFSNSSLAKKLTGFAIALTAGSLILITALVYLTIVSYGENFLESEIDEKANFIKKSFVEPMWTYNQHSIDEIGSSLLINSKYTYLTALKIESNNSEVLFEKTQGEGLSFAQVESLPFTKSKKVDIFKDQQKIGTISFAMTNFGYIKAFRTQLLIILSVSLLMLLMLSMYVRYFYNRTLTTPLNKIMKQVNELENEKYHLKKVEGLPVELESFSNALVHAATLIDKRNSDIKYYTNHLEKLVLERTAELETQIGKNINTARMVAVGEMAADVAHEINNPLTVIDLYLSKIKKVESTHELPQDVSLSIEKIQVMVKRIGKIIKSLKSLSRDGTHDPKIPFSVSNIVEDVKMLVDMKLSSHDIRFSIVFDNPSLVVIGSQIQISQVLVNLIGNAIDAVSSLPLSDKWITLEIKEMENDVYFYITDCGDGIPLELQEKIMRPFFTTKEVNKGTGLGLSISRNILDDHGGSLEYNSNHPNTQFYFYLKKESHEMLLENKRSS